MSRHRCCSGGGDNPYPAGAATCPTKWQSGTRTITIPFSSSGYRVGKTTVTGPFTNGCPQQCDSAYPDGPVYVPLYYRKCILHTTDMTDVGANETYYIVQPQNSAALQPPCVVTPYCDNGDGRIYTHPAASSGVTSVWNVVTASNLSSFSISKISETPNGTRVIDTDAQFALVCATWSNFWGNPESYLGMALNTYNLCNPSLTTGKWLFLATVCATATAYDDSQLPCLSDGCLIDTYETGFFESWRINAIYGKPVTPGFNTANPYPLSGSYPLLWSYGAIPENRVFEQSGSFAINCPANIRPYNRVLAPPCTLTGSSISIDCSTTELGSGTVAPYQVSSCSSAAPLASYGLSIPTSLSVS